MGLFQFAKDVGKKLGLDLGGQQQQAQAKPAAAPAAAPQASPADQDRQKAVALLQLFQQMGMKGDDLGVRFDGEKVTLTGKVETQEEREKLILLAGNHHGIGSVDDQLQVAKPEAAGTFYDVKSGDTLSKIAKQFYGDANKYEQIFEANRPMLKSADEIYPGQKLRIPAQAAVGAHA
ncbi:MAG TPA: peptidoglycan-binding protein LysM [Thermoanaerobaculia bacterium]|jgi:nucleoid-associated protein YgaU|nr:peptidoglycan-binding protein LysM [Thermoanaerobaculia bacterium]